MKNRFTLFRRSAGLGLLLALAFAPALRAQSPPTITAQPLSQYFVPGQSVNFSVTATGSAPLAYQWYFYGTIVPGATDSNFTIANAQAADVGRYQVIISNSDDATISAAAWLEPATVEPASVTALHEGAFTLSLPAISGPLTYTWLFNGTNEAGNDISTVAGNGTTGPVSGDGGPATKAWLPSVAAVAVDASGNLFIAENNYSRIRKVTPYGIITTVAGNATSGFSGDGGPATNASLHYPSGVAVDSYGRLFIADTDNSRIREVDTNGVITTVVGRGTSGYSGDGGPATNASLNYPLGVAVDAAGDLFIADTDNDAVRKVDTNGIITTIAGSDAQGYAGDGAFATEAKLHSPSGVAVDAQGNLFIADMYNDRIRKVDTNGVITTVAGNGNYSYSGDGGPATNASLRSPGAVAVDASGNLFIGDNGNYRVRKVDTNGIITTIAGNGTNSFSGDGGLATNASLTVAGVALDAFGGVFIADQLNGRIRKAGSPSAPSLTLSNASPANSGSYSVIITGPSGSVTSSVAMVTVLEVEAPSITTQPQSRYFAAGQSVTLSAAATGTAPLNYQWKLNGTNLPGATDTSLIIPNAQAADAGAYKVAVSNAYGFANSSAAELVQATVASPVIVPVGGTFTLSVPILAGPFTYTWFSNGTNEAGNTISTVAGMGTFYEPSGDGGPATNAGLRSAGAVALDLSGNLFIVESNYSFVRKVAPNGIISTVARYSTNGGPATNAGIFLPCGVAADSFGRLFIADTGYNNIREMDANGIFSTVAGHVTNGFSGDGGPATNAYLNFPSGVAVDAVGNLFIADRNNNRIRKVDTIGIITTVAGTGTAGYSGDGGAATNARLVGPYGVAVDAAGNLFIADAGNNRVRKVDTNGIITTFAGNGTYSYSGDRGPAASAGLSDPGAVAVDAAGNLFISDNGNHRVRKVDTSGIITTYAGNGTNSFSGDGGPAPNASLSVSGVALDAFGSLYIADVDNGRVRKVGSPDAPSVTLSSVALADGGSYSVVITGPSGSVTSSVAQVTVVATNGTAPFPPQVAVSPPTNNTIQLNWTAPQSNPPLGYQVQFTTNLAAPNWQNAGGVITPTNGPVSVSAPASAPESYYRLLLVQ